MSQVIYDESDKVIKNPDLTKGIVRPEQRIKSDAKPIDNKKKFAWDDDDYENIMRYHVWTDEELALMEEREREIAKHEAREAFLETAPAIQAEQDAAICELYEMVMEVNNESA